MPFQRRIQPPNTNEVQVSLRLPRAWHIQLKREAAEVGVSLNVYLNRMVHQQMMLQRERHPEKD